jgi:hypothetical protein
MSQRKPDPEFVAAEVRAEMGRQGRTNSWLAVQLGVSEMWVGRRLRIPGREVDLSEDDLDRIADVLGVPVSKFLPAEVRAA